MKKHIFILLLPLLMVQAKAQNWDNVSTGFNSYPNYFFSDVVAGKLYATGYFGNAGSIFVNGCASFDGNYWDTLPIPQNFIKRFNVYRYGNKLIFGSDTIYSFDGNKVDTIGYATSGSVYRYNTYQGDLIAFGNFDSINNIKAYSIARWNGSTWSAFDTTKFSQGITAVQEYQGHLYAGGNFSNWNATLKRLAKWDGAQWLPVGNGIVGGFAGVGSFEVYNGDLYIGGGFKTADGNPANCVARWDGTQWKDAGVGMTSLNAVVEDLQVYNNELYACGQFYWVGNAPIWGIAKWNGSEWCGLGQETTPSYLITCMAVYNNELIIGGPFKTIDGDTVNYVAKWVGGNYVDTCAVSTSLQEVETNFGFALYPNPATTHLTITLPELTQPAVLTITNISGSILQIEQLSAANTTVPLHQLPPGLYFATIQTNQQRITQKFIKLTGY